MVAELAKEKVPIVDIIEPYKFNPGVESGSGVSVEEFRFKVLLEFFRL